MQIKMTLRFHVIPVRMAKSNKTNAGEDNGKGHTYSLTTFIIPTATVEISVAIPRESGNHSTLRPILFVSI